MRELLEKPIDTLQQEQNWAARSSKALKNEYNLKRFLGG